MQPIKRKEWCRQVLLTVNPNPNQEELDEYYRFCYMDRCNFLMATGTVEDIPLTLEEYLESYTSC